MEAEHLPHKPLLTADGDGKSPPPPLMGRGSEERIMSLSACLSSEVLDRLSVVIFGVVLELVGSEVGGSRVLDVQ